MYFQCWSVTKQKEICGGLTWEGGYRKTASEDKLFRRNVVEPSLNWSGFEMPGALVFGGCDQEELDGEDVTKRN